LTYAADEALSKDLQNEFPGMSGFSATNLKRMRRFAEHYPVMSIRPQAVAQLPWGHIATFHSQWVKAIFT
jgi:hypothetical protein